MRQNRTSSAVTMEKKYMRFGTSATVLIGSSMLFGFDPEDLELIRAPKVHFSMFIRRALNYGL